MDHYNKSFNDPDGDTAMMAFSVNHETKSIAMFIDFFGLKPVNGPNDIPGYITAFGLNTAKVLAQSLLDAIESAEGGQEFGQRTITVDHD